MISPFRGLQGDTALPVCSSYTVNSSLDVKYDSEHDRFSCSFVHRFFMLAVFHLLVFVGQGVVAFVTNVIKSSEFGSEGHAKLCSNYCTSDMTLYQPCLEYIAGFEHLERPQVFL